MAAIGQGDVTLDLAFTESRTDGSAKPSWRSTAKALTDFSTIRVRVPMPALRTPLREFIVAVRGILHHESGHIRFTIPLPELIARGASALDAQDSADLRVGTLQMAWNCLEDQRMEAAVIRATPRIATYFVPMVLAYVLAETEAKGYLSDGQRAAIDGIGPWIALAGRSHIPADIRVEARDAFDGVVADHGLGSDDWFEIVARYLGATDPSEMLQAVVDAHEFLAQLMDLVATERDTGASHLSTMAMVQTREALAKKITDTSEQHQAMTDSEGADPHDSASSPDWPEAPNGESQPAAREAYASASAEVEDVMSRIDEQVGAGVLSCNVDSRSYPMPEGLLATARMVSHDIRESLEVFRTERSPIWVRHQEHGYLDPLAFRTRQPGERTFHREAQQWDTNGFGLHVSFLADRSESMTTDMPALSQTLWAVKTACDALGIPSTMVLWSDGRQTVRVMEQDDAPLVYTSSGGTDPRQALEDLDSHVTGDGLHHLVFMFTDGEWATVKSLTEWTHADRTFVIIGLHCEASISNKDAEIVIPITSISDLGVVVKHVLADHVAMNSN
jgi:hypothetical protein